MPAVEGAKAALTAGDRPLLDSAERGLDAMADRPAPRGVTAGLVISDVLVVAPLRLDHLGEGLVGGGGCTEEEATVALLEATPSDADRGETAFR